MGLLTNIVARFVEHFSTDPADPREETAEQAAIRLYHLERSAKAVHNKILKVYDIDGKMTQAELDTFLPIAVRVADAWVPPPGMDSEQQAKIREVIEQTAMDYFGIYAMARVMEAKPDVKPGYGAYHSRTAAARLTEVYANHRCNIAEARCIALGMDAFAAHALDGYIIKHTILEAHGQGYDKAKMLPVQERPVDDLDTIHHIERLRNYWRNREAEVKQAIRPDQVCV